MSQLEGMSYSLENLAKSLSDAKKQRMQVEQHSQMLKNKIGSLRLKERLSAQKIEKFRSLTQKLTKIKQDKLDSYEKSETVRKEHIEALEAQNKAIRENSYLSKVTKQENLNKMITQRREDYKTTKERQKFDEFYMIEQYERAKEFNTRIKNLMNTNKDVLLKDKDERNNEKRNETLKLHQIRMIQENNMMWAKYKEKEIMENADLGIIECLHNGLFS